MKNVLEILLAVFLIFASAACRSGNMAAVSEQSDSQPRVFESALVIPDSGSEFSYRVLVRKAMLDRGNQALSVVWKVSDRADDAEFDCKKLIADKNSRRIPVVFASGQDEFSTSIPIARNFFEHCDLKAAAGTAKLPKDCLIDASQRDVIGSRVDSCLLGAAAGKSEVLAQGTATPQAIAIIEKKLAFKSILSKDGQSKDYGLGDVDDIVAYGEMCAQSMGPIPEFSCLDGEVIKIFKDGVEQNADSEKCDNPSYLTSFGGECRVHSRIGRLSMANPNVDAVFICRHFKPARSANDPNFQDIAMIQHDRVSGNTCWFQALAAEQPGQADLNGIRVAPPAEGTIPAGWQLPDRLGEVERLYGKQIPKNSRSFWLRPSRTAEISCIRCHDSDPYVLTPHVAEVQGTTGDFRGQKVVPCDPGSKDSAKALQCDRPGFTGRYRNLGKFMSGWQVAYAIEPREDRQCVQCHRIGSLGTRDNLASDSVGEQMQQATHRTNLSLSFPKNHWMAPDHLKRNKNAWDRDFERPWQSLKFCLDNWIQRKGPDGQNENFKEYCKATAINSSQPIASGGIVKAK
jgi:hypothetical protein